MIVPKKAITKIKAYTLVHADNNGNAVFRDDGFYDLVAPIDAPSDGILIFNKFDATELLDRHNDPYDYGTPCVLVEIEVSVNADVR